MISVSPIVLYNFFRISYLFLSLVRMAKGPEEPTR